MGSQWKAINASYRNMEGYKRVAWPPVSENEFNKQPSRLSTPLKGAPVQPNYRAASYDTYQQAPTQQQGTAALSYKQQPLDLPPAHQNPTKQQQQQLNNFNSYTAQTNSTEASSNSISQFQQQQHQLQTNTTVSHDTVDLQVSKDDQIINQDYSSTNPGIIQLRKQLPGIQTPSQVYNSQPAALTFKGGCNMRGDLKWPPPEYKVAAALEDEERRKMALGPACRPRKVNRDYTSYFAKNATNCYYPGYKVPPGTQHILA